MKMASVDGCGDVARGQDRISHREGGDEAEGRSRAAVNDDRSSTAPACTQRRTESERSQ